MSLNKNLQKAKREKNDDFYTQLSDIENELKHYHHHFEGKVVYCNCDDPKVSNFYHYFSHKFHSLGLKKLVTTCYKNRQHDMFSNNDDNKSVWLECSKGIYEDGGYRPSEPIVRWLKGDGDFRSVECVELLKQADIVVTNPPFSLFREYVAQLTEHEKKFVIIGSKNAITFKEIFPLIKDNQIWSGYGFQNGNAYFAINNTNNYAKGVYDQATGLVKFRNVGWYTNLDHSKRHEELILYKRYSPEEYPKYDNYDAIEVSKVESIPSDYDGEMGVPITFLDKHNPDQFELLGATESEGKGFSNGLWFPDSGVAQPVIGGKRVYKRLFIRNRRPQS